MMLSIPKLVWNFKGLNKSQRHDLFTSPEVRLARSRLLESNNYELSSYPVFDLGFSKGGFWFCKKFSSEQEKR